MHFQTHVGGTQAPKPQRVLGFDPLPFLGSNPATQAGSKFPAPVGGTEAPNAESGLGF